MASHAQNSLDGSLKPFKLSDPQFNMDTYFGRLGHFFSVFNPM